MISKVEIVLYDKEKGREAVVKHDVVTREDIKDFCVAMNVQFHAMGCPPGLGGEDWDDETVFRVATHDYPARGVTVKLDEVARWASTAQRMFADKNPIDSIENTTHAKRK